MSTKKDPRFLTPAWWKALLKRTPKTSMRELSTSYRNADGGTRETGPVEQK